MVPPRPIGGTVKTEANGSTAACGVAVSWSKQHLFVHAHTHTHRVTGESVSGNAVSCMEQVHTNETNQHVTQLATACLSPG